MSTIHQSVPAVIARYDLLVSMTRYTRAEVEAVYVEMQAAEADLMAACEQADAVLEPQRVDMGLWKEIPDEQFHALESLLYADLPVAHQGKVVEQYPLKQWAKAAAAWRTCAKRIRREIARLEKRQ